MSRSHKKIRERARMLFLTSEVDTNVEIAARLKVKPHTIGRWRHDEDWDGLKRKIDVRAGEMFVEKIASERTSLNLRHYQLWQLVLSRTAEGLKQKAAFDVRDIERVAAIVDRAQKGQRLSKGLSSGETEEAIRAQSEADLRRLIDTFIDAVRENVGDEETRDRIRQAIIAALPTQEGSGTGEPGDPLVQ